VLNTYIFPEPQYVQDHVPNGNEKRNHVGRRWIAVRKPQSMDVGRCGLVHVEGKATVREGGPHVDLQRRFVLPAMVTTFFW
jgi:hypothetical protein